MFVSGIEEFLEVVINILLPKIRKGYVRANTNIDEILDN